MASKKADRGEWQFFIRRVQGATCRTAAFVPDGTRRVWYDTEGEVVKTLLADSPPAWPGDEKAVVLVWPLTYPLY